MSSPTRYGHGLENRDLSNLIERVSIATDPAYRQTPARVEMQTGGVALVASYDTGVPATDLEAQGRKLRAKFAGLATPLLSDQAHELAEQALRLESVQDARGLGACRAVQPVA